MRNLWKKPHCVLSSRQVDFIESCGRRPSTFILSQSSRVLMVMIQNNRMFQVAKRPIYQHPYPIPRMLMPPATIIAPVPSVACEEWRAHRSFSRPGSGATPKGRIYECEPGKGKTLVDLDRNAEPELPFEALWAFWFRLCHLRHVRAGQSLHGERFEGSTFRLYRLLVPMFVRELLFRKGRRKVCQGQAYVLSIVQCRFRLRRTLRRTTWNEIFSRSL